MSPEGVVSGRLTVNLVCGEQTRLRYPVTALYDDGVHLVVRGTWAEASERDVGYVRFAFGDVWTEHYWRDRWYAVKEIRAELWFDSSDGCEEPTRVPRRPRGIRTNSRAALARRSS
jgi:hypothetical protein